MFKPVIKETVTVNIIKQIRAMIQSGDFKPGEMIPSERELTEVFLVSRIAVREAIKALEANGLLEVKPGEGTFVRNPTSHDLIDPQTNILATKQSFKELLELRLIVEVEIAGFAASRATAEDLSRIKKTLSLMEKDITQGKSHLKTDFDFHDALADSAGNDLLTRMMLTVRDLMRESVYLSTRVEDANHHAFNGHHRVYERIVDRDVDGAKAAMLDHLRQVEEDLFKAQEIVLGEKLSYKKSEVQGDES